jgi:DNA topoisomerase-1
MSLVYYPDQEPGYSRKRWGRGFSFYNPDGVRLTDRLEIERLKGIGVPPAYEDVWLSPLANGHLLATGRDARRRKQYRYHPDWQLQQANVKFDQLVPYGEALPKLRRWISERLKGDVGEEETAIAAVLALMDRGSVRVGDEAYTEQNRSYGASTIRSRHVNFDGDEIRLSYTGKGGKAVRKSLRGKSLQRVLERSRDLPGAALVNWIDDSGAARSVRSEQVNEMLESICAEGITSKTIRTWNGTHAAFREAQKPGRLTISMMAKAASERLHNTETIARNSYIHPDVIALAELETDERKALSKPIEGASPMLRAGEAELLAYLAS